jgi:hypothetical protein
MGTAPPNRSECYASTVAFEDRARQERAALRAKAMVIRKARLGEPELDFSPVRGAEAISLTTRLTIESFSLARLDSVQQPRSRMAIRFVPRTPA